MIDLLWLAGGTVPPRALPAPSVPGWPDGPIRRPR